MDQHALPDSHPELATPAPDVRYNKDGLQAETGRGPAVAEDGTELDVYPVPFAQGSKGGKGKTPKHQCRVKDCPKMARKGKRCHEHGGGSPCKFKGCTTRRLTTGAGGYCAEHK